MRPLKLSLVVTTALIAAFASCKKGETVAPAPANYISLNYNSMGMRTANVTHNYSSGTLSVMGFFNSHTMVSFGINQPAVGVFDIGGGQVRASFSAGASDEYMSNNGTISVTSIAGDTLRGTFRLHCVEVASGHTCEIIDGAFQVVNYGQ